MSLKTAVLVCAIFLGLSSVALADIKVHKGAQVQLDIPESWKVKGGQGSDDMILLDANEDMIIFLRVLDAKDLKQAAKDADAFIMKNVEQVKWNGKAKQDKLNGMTASVSEGTGKFKGADVELGALVVITPSKKPMLVFGVMDHSKSATLQPQINAFLASIKPAK